MNNMFKRKYFKKALKKYNIEEKKNEEHNLEKAEQIIKKIIKKPNNTAVEKLNKKAEKESKLKPINTHILLKGFH